MPRPVASGWISRGEEMAKQSSGWGRELDEPIELPDGRKRDAASYITALPKKEADASEWQAAIETLMLMVELGGPTTFARIDVDKTVSGTSVDCRGTGSEA